MKTVEPDENGHLKTEDTSYLKDPYNKAVLSADKNKLKQHLLRREQFQRSKSAENEINSMKEEINTLKDDVGEVKTLLQTIIDKL